MLRNRDARDERELWPRGDRKSTRLNSSHLVISYAVFCLKKKKQEEARTSTVCVSFFPSMAISTAHWSCCAHTPLPPPSATASPSFAAYRIHQTKPCTPSA